MTAAAEHSLKTPSAPRGRTSGWLITVVHLLPILILGVGAFLELPMCPAKSILGVPCPGCGLTRATIAAAHFDFATMWSMHPLALLITPTLLGTILWSYVHAMGWKKAPRRSDRFRSNATRLAIAFGLLIMGLWIARLALGTHPDFRWRDDDFHWKGNKASALVVPQEHAAHRHR